MANKDKFTDDNIDLDNLDLDSLDSDLEFDNTFETPGPKHTKERKPHTDFNTGILESFKPSASNFRKISTAIDRSFPKTGQAISSSIDTISEVRRLSSDVVRNVTPTLNRLKIVSHKFLPKVKSIMPKKLYDTLDEKLSHTEERYEQQSEEDMREGLIKDQMVGIFNQEQKDKKVKYQEDRVKEEIDRQVDISRHTESTTIFSQIRNILKSNQIFFNSTFKGYLMKSLELQFKHFFVAKDLFAVQKGMLGILDVKLEQIKHNTALPEVQKKRASEIVKEYQRARTVGALGEKAGDIMAGYAKKLTENIKNNVFKKVEESFNSMGGMVADGGEQYLQLAEMQAEMGETPDSASKIAGKTVGSLITSMLVKMGMGGLKASLGDKAATVDDMTVHLQKKLMAGLRNKTFDSDNAFLRWIGTNILPVLKENRGQVENVLEKSATDDVDFDVLTRRSIVEIIPGFLSKILQQTTMANMLFKAVYPAEKTKKVKTPEELVFDKRREDFITSSDLKKDYELEIFGTKKSRTDQVGGMIDKIYASYMMHKDASRDEFEESLPDIVKFLTNLIKHVQLISPKAILKFLKGDTIKPHEEQYLNSIFKDVPSGARMKLANILAKSFFKDIDSKDEQLEVVESVVRDVDVAASFLSQERDRFMDYLGELNVFGYKRHLKGVIRSKSAEEVERYRKKMVREALQQQRKKHKGAMVPLTDLQKSEIDEKVTRFARESGIAHEYMREKFGDVDYDEIKDRLSSDEIGEYQKKTDTLGEKITGKSVADGIKKAITESLPEYLRYRLGLKTKQEEELIEDSSLEFRRTMSERETERTREDIEDLSGEDTRSHDSLNVSGPGVYVQGVDEELHMPLDKASVFWQGAAFEFHKALENSTFLRQLANPAEVAERRKLEEVMAPDEYLNDPLLTKMGEDVADIKSAVQALYGLKSQTDTEILAALLSMNDNLSSGMMKRFSNLIKGTGKISKRVLDAYINAIPMLGGGLFNITKAAATQAKKEGGSLVGMLDRLFFGEKGADAEDGKKKGFFSKMFSGLGSIYKSSLTLQFSLLTKVLGLPKDLPKKVMSGIRKASDLVRIGVFKQKPFVDIYLKDNVVPGKPLVTAQQQENKEAVLASGEPIKNSRSIKEPVINASNQNVLISTENIQHGLVDVNNKPLIRKIGLTEIASKAFRHFKSWSKMSFKAGVGVAGAAIDTGLGTIGGLFNRLRGKQSESDGESIVDKFKRYSKFNFRGPERGEGSGSGGLLPFGKKKGSGSKDMKKVITRLDKIIKSLAGDKKTEKKKMKLIESSVDQLGKIGSLVTAIGYSMGLDVKGLFQDNVFSRLKDKVFRKDFLSRRKRKEGTAAGDKGKQGIMGSLLSMFSGKGKDGEEGEEKKEGGGMLSNMIATAGAALVGTKAAAIGVGLKAGALAAGTFAKGALVAGALKAGAAGLFLVSNPVGWAILGGAAAAAVGAYAYKKYGEHKLRKKYRLERMKKLYGANEDLYDQIEELEDYINGLEPGEKIPDKKMTYFCKEFGFDPNKKEHFSYFVTWFLNRFGEAFNIYRNMLKMRDFEYGSEDDIPEEMIDTIMTDVVRDFNRKYGDMKDLVPYPNALSALERKKKKDEATKKEMSSSTVTDPSVADRSDVDKKQATTSTETIIQKSNEKTTSGVPGGAQIIPFPGSPKIDTDSYDLGKLSAKYESGTKGDDAIGYDRAGGTSYGKYQIASATGTFDQFLKWAASQGPVGKEVAERLSAAGVPNTGSRSGAVPDEWRKLAAEGKIADLSHRFIKETHYDKALNRIQNTNLRNTIGSSKTLQNVLWSSAVQHGPPNAAKIFDEEYDGVSDENELIKKVYDRRKGFLNRQTGPEKQAVLARYDQELKMANSMFQQEDIKSKPKPEEILVASLKEPDKISETKATVRSPQSSSFSGTIQQASTASVATNIIPATFKRPPIEERHRAVINTETSEDSSLGYWKLQIELLRSIDNRLGGINDVVGNFKLDGSASKTIVDVTDKILAKLDMAFSGSEDGTIIQAKGKGNAPSNIQSYKILEDNYRGQHSIDTTKKRVAI